MADITPLASNQINPNTDFKTVINQLVTAVNAINDSGPTAAGMMAYFDSLPTADPHVVGAPWLNAHVLTLSAG